MDDVEGNSDYSILLKFGKMSLGLQLVQILLIMGLLVFLFWFLPPMLRQNVDEYVDRNRETNRDYMNELTDDLVVAVSEKIELKLKILNLRDNEDDDDVEEEVEEML